MSPVSRTETSNPAVCMISTHLWQQPQLGSLYTIIGVPAEARSSDGSANAPAAAAKALPIRWRREMESVMREIYHLATLPPCHLPGPHHDQPAASLPVLELDRERPAPAVDLHRLHVFVVEVAQGP